jgi:small subunit ribosomal protein S4
MITKNCRNCRKIGAKLFLKGERCLSPKCSVSLRSYPPGSHGPSKKIIRKSEYGLQLAAKQQVKIEYGIRERQFRRYFKLASKSSEATGEKLLQNLEIRFDNIIYRLGWSSSRNHARQMILHGKFKVNHKKINIPSYPVKLNDIIEPKNKETLNINKVPIPNWINFDKKNMQAKIERLPARTEMESPVDEQLIVEFYSR